MQKTSTRLEVSGTASVVLLDGKIQYSRGTRIERIAKESDRIIRISSRRSNTGSNVVGSGNVIVGSSFGDRGSTFVTGTINANTINMGSGMRNCISGNGNVIVGSHFGDTFGRGSKFTTGRMNANVVQIIDTVGAGSNVVGSGCIISSGRRTTNAVSKKTENTDSDDDDDDDDVFKYFALNPDEQIVRIELSDAARVQYAVTDLPDKLTVVTEDSSRLTITGELDSTGTTGSFLAVDSSSIRGKGKVCFENLEVRATDTASITGLAYKGSLSSNREDWAKIVAEKK